VSISQVIRRTITPEVKVLDSRRGIAEYIVSDELIDSCREIIRASGWRFNWFSKNAPFVDRHSHDPIPWVVGTVVEYEVRNGKLHEVVQWAIDVSENTLARVGWKMTEAGYLKALAVGFFPTRAVRGGEPGFLEELRQLGLPADADVRTIYQEQQQVELSSVIIGSNPSAFVKAAKAGVLTRCDLDILLGGGSTDETDHRAEFLRKLDRVSTGVPDASGAMPGLFDSTKKLLESTRDHTAERPAERRRDELAPPI
jgi:hypothetical protein